MTEEALTDFSDVPAQVHRLTSVGLVHDGASQEEIEERRRQIVLLLLANAPTVRTVDGVKHRLAIESVIIWVWNTCYCKLFLIYKLLTKMMVVLKWR